MDKPDSEMLRKAMEGVAAMTANIARKAKKSKPYYHKEAALEAKQWIDKLHSNEQEGKSLLIISETLMPNSQALRFWQGQEYLVDNLDPDKIYNTLKDKHKLTKGRHACELSIAYKASATTVTEGREWKFELEKFMHTAEHLQKIIFTNTFDAEDEDYIRTTLDQLNDLFVYDLKPNMLLVIRKGPPKQ